MSTEEQTLNADGTVGIDSNGEPDFITEQQARDFGLLKTPEQIAALEEEEKKRVVQLENDLIAADQEIQGLVHTLSSLTTNMNNQLIAFNRAIDRKYGCAAQLGDKETCDAAMNAAIGIHAQKSREAFEVFRAHTTFLMLHVEG